MTSPQNRSLSPQGGNFPIPDGLRLPEVIITRRTRTQSMNGRIEDEIREGTVKFFCRSRGHGFIDDDQVSLDDFHSILFTKGKFVIVYFSKLMFINDFGRFPIYQVQPYVI